MEKLQRSLGGSEKRENDYIGWKLVFGFYNPARCAVTSADIVWLERPKYNLEEMGKIDAAL